MICVVLSVLALGCSKDADEAVDASSGDMEPSTSGESTPSADASTSTDGASEACPFEGGISLQLGSADVTLETVDLGAGSYAWSLVAAPGVPLPAFGPGDELVVSLAFDGVFSATREGREFTVSISAEDGGTSFATVSPQTVTTSTGELAPGPWLPSLSTNAGGEPIRLTLGGITINPNQGEGLTCFSVRAQIPTQANRVDDSSLIDLVTGSDLVISEVRLSMTGEGDAEPFGLAL